MTDLDTHRHRAHYFGLLLGLLAGTCWGTTSIATRYMAHVRGVHPLVTVFWRFAIATPLLFAACRVWARGGRKFNWRDLPELVFLSAVGTFLMSNCSFGATKFTTNFNVTLIMSASAVIIGIIAVLKGEKVSRAQWLAVWAGLLGVAFIGLAKNPAEKGLSYLAHGAGIGLAVVGSIAWAVYTYYGRGIVAKYGGLRVTTWAIALGGVMQAPLAYHAGVVEAARGFAPGDWAVMLYVGLVPTAFAFALWFVALHYIDATTLGMTQYAGPVLNAVLGWMLLGEPLLWQHFIGAALIFAGLHFASRPPLPPESPSPNS